MKTLCISQEAETRRKFLSNNVSPDMRTNTGKKNRDLSKAWNGSSFWLKDLRLLQGRSSTYVQQIAHESTNLIQFQNKGKKQLHYQNANQAKKVTICYTGKMCSRQKVMQATIKMLLGEMLYRRVCTWQMSIWQLSTRHMSTRQIRTR